MSDAVQRALFCKSINQDFSLIAPAGVGKTYSIVERIFTLAQEKPEELPALCVITYTRKAAETLKVRTFERLKQSPNFKAILPLLEQSFFGTIHSLCWQHIQQFYPQKPFEILQDEAVLREQFLSQFEVKTELGNYVLRFVDEEVLLDLANDLSPNEMASDVLESLPIMDLSPIYDYPPEPRNRVQIERMKRLVEQWEKTYREDETGFLPECSVGGEGFKQCFYEAFRPFYGHLGKATLRYAQILAKDYFEFRVRKGYLRHSDLVHLAQNCLQKEAGQAFFKEKKLHVLLDEAQDTDVDQFKYLLSLVEMRSDNRFSMVGDPQQSIYGSRSNIAFYLKIHEERIRKGHWQELVFTDTYRCPKAIVDALNEHFPKILNKAKDPQQVDYVPLRAARADWEGSFRCIELPENTTELSNEAFEIHYLAEFIQKFLKENKVKPSSICVLAPRNDWLQAIAEGFKSHGLQLQLHSKKATGRQNALFCAVLAFIHLLNFLDDTFELAGMLYGLFDVDAYILTEYSLRLQIEQTAQGKGSIDSILEQLRQLRKSTLALNLYLGTQQLITFFQDVCLSNDTDETVIEILLEKAFEAVQEHRSWAYLEAQLRTYLDTTLDVDVAVDPNAIQGFSCHKAKGLEWETVILPFIHRPIRPKPVRYPYIHKDRLFLHKYDKDSTLSADYHRELQRLLYVACTRSQKNFFYFNDAVLWDNEGGSSFGFSF